MMAARGSRSLVLDISADVTKLGAGVKVARSAFLELQRGAESVEAAVRQSMSDLMPVESARAAEQEMNRIFRSIKSNAQAVLNSGDAKAGLKLFDLGAADEQMRALTASAGELRQWSAAAEIASQEGGEFATRLQQISVAAMAEAAQLEAQAQAIDETASAFRMMQAQIGATTADTRVATEASSQQRAGMQQLSYQLNDVATMFALGAKPQQIFASQSGQIIHAVQMMTAGTSKFAAFLSGPWGIALTMGIVALTPLVGKLFEAEEAAEAAEMGADALGQAQGVLGKIFDLTTGKIENQNQMLRINALLMARNLEAEAQTRRASARDALSRATEGGAVGFFEAQTMGISGLGPTTGGGNSAAARKLLGDIGSGTITRADAIARAETMDFTGTRVSRDEFIGALRDAEWANENDRIARKIRESLDSNELVPDLRREATEKKGGTDKSDQLAREALKRRRSFEDDIASAERAELSSRIRLATSAEARHAMQLQLLDAETVGWQRELERQVEDNELTQAQADQLTAILKRTDAIDRQILQQEEQARIIDRQVEIEKSLLDEKIAELRFQMGFASSRRERKAIADRLLQRELDMRRVDARRLQDSDNPDDQRRGDELMAGIARDETRGYRENERTYGDPVTAYLRHLREAADATDEALQDVQANGLQNLEDGLVGVISGTESLGKAFKRMSDQIIADLVRIGVQKAILGAVGDGGFLRGLFGFSAGGPVDLLPAQYKAAGGMILGPGSGTSDSIPAMLSNGEYVIRAAMVDKHLPLIEAINSDRLQLPGFAAGGLVAPRLPKLPKLPSLAALDGAYRGGARDKVEADVRVSVQAGPEFDARVEEVSTRTVAMAAEPIAAAAESRTMRSLQRPGLPGGYG